MNSSHWFRATFHQPIIKMAIIVMTRFIPLVDYSIKGPNHVKDWFIFLKKHFYLSDLSYNLLAIESIS